MAQVTLQVGGRRYDLACRDGEEAHLRALAVAVDAKAQDAARVVGSGNEIRQLLLAALLLADDLAELRAAPAGQGDAALAGPLDALAERLEQLAERLEKDRAAP